MGSGHPTGGRRIAFGGSSPERMVLRWLSNFPISHTGIDALKPHIFAETLEYHHGKLVAERNDLELQFRATAQPTSEP